MLGVERERESILKQNIRAKRHRFIKINYFFNIYMYMYIGPGEDLGGLGPSIGPVPHHPNVCGHLPARPPCAVGAPTCPRQGQIGVAGWPVAKPHCPPLHRVGLQCNEGKIKAYYAEYNKKKHA